MGERKLKIADLSREIDIHRNSLTLLYYEKVKKIDLEMLDRLCKYFDCSVSDILEFKEDESK